MTEDDLESMRRQMWKQLNEQRVKDKIEAEEKFGIVWDTQELQRDYTVIGFLAPFVVVYRKSDGKKGSLLFQDSPRYYHSWSEDR